MSNEPAIEVSKKKRTFRETEISEIDSDSEAGKENDKPLTEGTKNLILTLIADPSINDPEKYLPLINKISLLSEQQALAYLECLNVSKNVKNHGKLSEKLTNYLSNYVCHPNDHDMKKLIAEDETIKDGMAYGIGVLLSLFGRYAPLVLIAIYGTTSWGSNYTFKKPSPKPTVPDDLLRPKSNGENNNLRENVSEPMG